MEVIDQVCVIFAGTVGLLDDVPLPEVPRFEQEMLDYLRDSHPGLLEGIRESADLDDDAEAALRAAVEDFKANVFAASAVAAG